MNYSVQITKMHPPELNTMTATAPIVRLFPTKIEGAKVKVGKGTSVGAGEGATEGLLASHQ